MRFVSRIPVTESSQAAEARRAAADIATLAGFDEVRKAEIAIVVTEAGNNIAKHSSGGEILLSTYNSLGTRRFEMLAIDRGPGMDVDICLVDGFSTKGTQGTGLGAISRLAAEFDCYSNPKGTVVFAGFTAEPETAIAGIRLGSARVPKNG